MKTRIVTPPEGIAAAVERLAAGELAALPTETVYGLGAAALDPLACARIFEAKARPLSDPLIVHVPEAGWLDELSLPNGLARTLAEAFWPGPLTMVVPRRGRIPDLVTAGQGTVALRMSAHPVFREVARSFGGPIAAPSANRFGRISPTSAAHVEAELGGRIPLILDGGPCAHGIESTIVLLREQGVEILRHGPVTREALAAYGEILPGRGGVLAPGTMKSHYAPRTPLEIAGGTACRTDAAKAGLLAWSGSGEGFAAVEFLSPAQDLREAAAGLYGAMRRLDDAGLERIVAEPVPETGLGVAIMERLRKAAARE
ncbi:MAG TPA: L-threonylcarbamoyladenylate synthase [Terrimicrobiaceae bacterium]|nr:L-threonylcarbamoyladenylate synthase [Terrimicrobiaceae bacterium]